MDWDITGRDTLTIQGDGYDGVAGEAVKISSYPLPTHRRRRERRTLGSQRAFALEAHLSGGSDIQIQVYYDRVSRLQANQAEYRNTMISTSFTI